MHIHDIGTLVWVIIVIAGVVSSLRKNMGAARRAASPRTPRAAAQAAQAVQKAAAAAGYVMAPVDVPGPVGVPPPAIEPVPAVPPQIAVRMPPPPAPPAPAFPVAAAPVRTGTAAVRGMFGRTSLVRAIVAAEVLGTPKALQEQSIWSPRHSEPSI